MTSFIAKKALLPEGFADNVYIEHGEGVIIEVRPQDNTEGVKVLDKIVLPALPNLHSHAFQRAIAGLTEYKTSDSDSFWTWRKAMYEFIEHFSPDDLEEIATKLYKEMRQAGYSCVGEFHYLHHQKDGQHYEEIAETSHRMIRAAKKAGIAITHMPVLYAFGGFGEKEAEDGQRPFINTPDDILDIVSSLYQEYLADPLVKIGFAFHSLRAVNKDMMEYVLKGLHDIDIQMPIHIHIAEQEKEVEECISFYGKRPVRWLLDNFEVNPHWCLIHATHLDETELRDLAHSGAVAGLCPTTEANLGDGVFNLKEYINYGGRFGIGSDSHISVDALEELRLLEYGQRLVHRQRNIACTNDMPHVGHFLYQNALSGGQQALGQKVGSIQEDSIAQFLFLDDDLDIHANDDEKLLDHAVFSNHKINHKV